MFFFLFLFVATIIYIVSFKNDFTKETIDKVVPVLVLVGAIIVLMLLLSIFM